MNTYCTVIANVKMVFFNQVKNNDVRIDIIIPLAASYLLNTHFEEFVIRNIIYVIFLITRTCDLWVISPFINSL